MNALIRVHPSMWLYAQMKHAHWCSWITDAIIWSLGKTRCRFLQQNAARTQYVDDVVMHCRWKTWPTLHSLKFHRRSVDHHSHHKFNALQKNTVLEKSKILQAVRYFECAAVRGLKNSHRRARPPARSGSMAGWGKEAQERWPPKEDRPTAEMPSYSGASQSAAPWNPQPRHQRNSTSWAVPASGQWKGPAAAAASSSSSSWWELKKAPAESSPQAVEDPWTKVNPWQGSLTWTSPTSTPWTLDNARGQLDTQQPSK